MAAMSDFTFMEQKEAKLFVNSPNTLEGNYTDKLDTASADFQKTASTVDFVIEGEAEVLAAVRELVSILPENNNSEAGSAECMDDLNRDVPDFAAEAADPAAALADLGDNNFFLEVKSGYAQEMVTGFLCFDGMTVGAVANRTKKYDEEGKETASFEARLTTAGCEKAAAFVKTCVEEEKTIAAAAAKLTAAFAESDVPKVNMITGNAYGSAYITMNSKHIGADMVFALNGAKVGMMDANVAAKIMYADDKDADLAEKAAQFAAQSGTEAAAARGYVDSVIEPASARKQLLYAFEMLYNKCEYPIGKKHGTI